MSISASLFIESQAKDTKTGPVGGVAATLKARRTMAGTSSGVVTSPAHLVYSRITLTMLE